MFESIYRLGICWRSTGRAVLLGKILILSCGLSLEPQRIGYPPAFRTVTAPRRGLHTVPDSQIHIDIWCMCFGGIWQIWARPPGDSRRPDFEIRHHSCFVAIAFLCPACLTTFDHHVPFCTTETVGSSTVWRLTVGWMTWFLQSILQRRALRSSMIQLWLRRHSSVACQVRME